MADKRYFWLKLRNTYFSQLEQKKLKKQPNGKEMQIIYLRMMLYSIDKGGYIYYQGVYDTLEEELAEEFDEDVEIVRSTIEFLIKNNMISMDEENNCFVPEAVNCTGSECYSAERMRRLRKKEKMSQCDTDVTLSDVNVTACDEEIEKEKEKSKSNNYQLIADMYNEICISFPRCTKLSDRRKKAIKARLKTYTIDDFKKVFEMAQASNFLKGKNDRNWSADFDWIIKDGNMAKILDGNYNKDRSNNTGKIQAVTPKNNQFHNFEQRNYDFDSLENVFIKKVNEKE